MIKEYILRDENASPLMDLLDNAGIVALPHSPEVHTIWKGYLNGLCDLIETTIPQCSVTVHKLDELAKAKEGLVVDHTMPLVTLDSYDTKGSFPFGVSRHFNPKGDFLGIGKRPGSKDLPEQVAQLKEFTDGSDIVLFEDDIFSGGTAKTVMEMLEQQGIRVAQFIAGLQVSRASADSRITAVHQYDPGDVYELNDPRDFLLGSHQAGLVINNCYALTRAPYVSPFVDITQRASIPADRAVAFSNAVLRLNKGVYSGLESLAGSPILFEHGSDPFKQFVASRIGCEATAAMTMLEFCDAVMAGS